MSSAQQAALKGKEQRDAALASGDLLLHPYKLTQFQPKKVRGRKTSPVVPGSTVEEQMQQKCKKYVEWMRKNKCTSRQNSGYVTNCNCRESIRDEDVCHAAVSMVNFFTLLQHGRDVRVQD